MTSEKFEEEKQDLKEDIKWAKERSQAIKEEERQKEQSRSEADKKVAGETKKKL